MTQDLQGDNEVYINIPAIKMLSTPTDNVTENTC